MKNKIVTALGAALTGFAFAAVATTPVTAQASAGDANLCLYFTSYYAGEEVDGITIYSDRLITGTPIPMQRHEVLRGECSKTKYPGLAIKWWLTPGTSSTFTRVRCTSQWGGYYYSSRAYGTSLISGKLSLICKTQHKNSSGVWV